MVVDAGSVDAGDASPAGAAGSASVGGSSGQAGVGGSGQTNANLITNGDFSDGESDWAVTDLAAPNGADAGAMVVDGALCTTVDTTGAFVVLGWPQDLSTVVHLSAGQTYTLSYDVRATGPLAVTIDAKVGHAVDPFTEDFSDMDDPGVDNLVQTFAHTHLVSSDDTEAGIALQLISNGASGSSTLCIDNVSLVEATSM